MKMFINHNKKLPVKMTRLVSFIISILVFLNATYVSADTGNKIYPFITNVRVENVDNPNGTANILWNTNLPVQSAVSCGTYTKAPYFYSRNKDNFGYEWTTKLMKGLVIKHKVPLDGLTSGLHHCRVASRLNDESKWVISEEITFNIEVGNTEAVNPIILESENKKEAVVNENKKDEETKENQEVKNDVSVKDENKKDDKILEKASVALFSLGNAFKSDICNDGWSVWVLVLIALWFAVVWPKELFMNLSHSESIKRLYVLSISGIVVFFIAIAKNSDAWIIPIGIGTVAFIMATIADILRKENSTVESRLMMVVKVLIAVFVVALFFALVLKWICSVLPILIAIITLIIRYALYKHKDVKKI